MPTQQRDTPHKGPIPIPNRRLNASLATIATLYLFTALVAQAQPNPALIKYACGPANRTFATLSSSTRFTDTTAGFDLIDSPQISDISCHSDKSFFFSIPVPEGNYRITVVLGGPESSVTTIRAEGRRLMLEKIATEPNASLTRTFDTNVRYPEIKGDPKNLVKLKPRELGILDWDHKLTLEFNGDHPSIRSIDIQPLRNVPTIYLAGDSTVVDQYYEPWSAWGQMLPRFFTPGIVIANHAESGETTKPSSPNTVSKKSCPSSSPATTSSFSSPTTT